MRVYCIFDEVAKQPVNVFVSINDETAERSFKLMLSSDSIFGLFPSQFSLYFVGELSMPGKSKDLGLFIDDGFLCSTPLLRGSRVDQDYLLFLKSRINTVHKSPDDVSSHDDSSADLCTCGDCCSEEVILND